MICKLIIIQNLKNEEIIMKSRLFYLILVFLLSLSFSKSLMRQDYLDGYVKFDLNDSDKIVAVLPFEGSSGLSASDYSSLYMGKYTNLDIIERQEIDKIMGEQDLFPDRLDDELRAKLKELFGADYIVLGKVWSKKHFSLVNIVLPWNWGELIFKHWFVKVRVVDADTGEIVSHYYNRDGHGFISLGVNDSYLSEKMEDIVLKMSDDFNNVQSSAQKETE